MHPPPEMGQLIGDLSSREGLWCVCDRYLTSSAQSLDVGHAMEMDYRGMSPVIVALRLFLQHAA